MKVVKVISFLKQLLKRIDMSIYGSRMCVQSCTSDYNYWLGNWYKCLSVIWFVIRADFPTAFHFFYCDNRNISLSWKFLMGIIIPCLSFSLLTKDFSRILTPFKSLTEGWQGIPLLRWQASIISEPWRRGNEYRTYSTPHKAIIIPPFPYAWSGA